MLQLVKGVSVGAGAFDGRQNLSNSCRLELWGTRPLMVKQLLHMCIVPVSLSTRSTIFSESRMYHQSTSRGHAKVTQKLIKHTLALLHIHILVNIAKGLGHGRAKKGILRLLYVSSWLA